MAAITISEVVQAKAERIEGLLNALSTELGTLGYGVEIVASNGSAVAQNALPTPIAGRAAPAKIRAKQKAYWRKIHKIMEEHNCDVQEARRIFKAA